MTARKFTFKSLAAIAMQRWEKADCEWIMSISRPLELDYKVAQWVLKKKF